MAGIAVCGYYWLLYYYYLSTEVNSMFLENYGGFQCTRGPIFDPFFYVFPAAFVFFF